MITEYMVDVSYYPFYFDPAYVIPLNIVVKDAHEFVVEGIVCHDFTNVTRNSLFVGPVWDTRNLENYDMLKDVEAFHHYYATPQLEPFQR